MTTTNTNNPQEMGTASMTRAEFEDFQAYKERRSGATQPGLLVIDRRLQEDEKIHRAVMIVQGAAALASLIFFCIAIFSRND